MEREKLLIKFCDFLTHVMGPETEVVLHDREGFIIWIAQGHITGREVGQQDLLPAMELVARQRAMEGFDYTTGYKSFSRKGTPLRSSSLFFRDEDGRLDYVLCVNQDISAYVNLQQMLDAFIGDRPTVARVQPEQDTLDDVVMKMILGEIARLKPADIDSKEAKLRLIARLNEKGIFGARGAVATVCELLHIAQPTLYKYLQESKDAPQA